MTQNEWVQRFNACCDVEGLKARPSRELTNMVHVDRYGHLVGVFFVDDDPGTIAYTIGCAFRWVTAEVQGQRKQV